MDEPIIERIIALIASTYPGVGTGGYPGIEAGDYVGFEMDVDHYLAQKMAFKNIETAPTSNPMSIIDIRANVAWSVSSIRKLNGAILDAWHMFQYPELAGAELKNYRELTIFRFVTVNMLGPYYVSGTLLVEGAKYRRLAEKHEREREEPHPPLPYFK